MADTILVAYGSKFGSTKEIAGSVAVALRECGHDVDLKPAGEVRSIDDYAAVVVGSAVYMGRWRRDALRLLRKHRRELADRDVWLFNSGPVGDQPTDSEEAQKWLRPPKVRALAEEIGAHDNAVFGGAISEDGSFVRRNMAKNTPAESRDLRDWDQIRVWALRIATDLAGITPLRPPSGR